LKRAQDAFSSVEDRQWLPWGALLLPNLKKVADEEDAECERKARLEEIWAREEASRKAEEDRRIAGEEAMTLLLENSGGMSAEEFLLKNSWYRAGIRVSICRRGRRRCNGSIGWGKY